MANRIPPKAARPSTRRAAVVASKSARTRRTPTARKAVVGPGAGQRPVSANPAAPAVRGSRMQLGASLCIHEAGASLAQLRVALEAGLTEIDASTLEAIDTAGLQLLLTAARAVHAQGRRLCISHTGKLLAATADALGLGADLAAVAELLA